MAEEFIRNYRRAPRVLVRLRALVGTSLQAETEDIGPGGCRLACPRLLAVGDHVRLLLEADSLRDPLRVAGHVVWRSSVRRQRLGIAYDEPSASIAAKWFDRFLASSPGIAVRMVRVPQMLAYSTVLAVSGAASPLHTEEELALLHELRSGMTVREVLERDPSRSRPRGNALFSLIGSHAVKIDVPSPTPRPPVVAPVPAARGRPAVAQEMLERADRLVAAGNSAAAIPILREALKHSPKDPQIAALLARAAFGPGKS